jgi:hypothetical protein
MMRSQSRRGRGDAGASLVLAMAFMTGVGVVVGALLTFSSTAITSAKFTLEHAQDANDVAGGLQAAINTVRTSTYDNGAGEDCLNSAGTLTYPGGDVAVTCTPKAGTGAGGSLVPISAANKPGYALLTLGDHSGEIGIEQTSNSVFRVRGKVRSNSGIEIAGSPCPVTPQPPTTNCSELFQLDPAATVTASGTCNGTIISTGPVSCGSAGPAGDPGYAQPPVSGATVGAVPGCGSTWIVQLSPGVYRDSAALNTLMKCKKVVLFKPGTYFFDFRNGEPGQPGGGHVWTIDDPATTVIGGTPNGWSASAATRPAFTMPGSCVSPLTTQSANSGVEFVFGGDSRLLVDGGDVELCGQWYASRPPITIHGAKADDGVISRTGPVGTATSTASGSNSPFLPTGPGTLKQAVAAEDGTTAAASLMGKTKATLASTGFVPATPPAAGSVLRSATLRVRHRVMGSGVTDWAATATPTGGTKDSVFALPISTAWTTTAVDVSADLAALVGAGTFNGLAVSLSASSSNQAAAMVEVDSLQLELEWIPATGIRGQNTPVAGTANCVSAVPNPGCALITTRGTKTEFYVTGTTYVPLAVLDIELTNASGQVFRSGLIARRVKIAVTPSSSFAGPVIEVPDDAFGPIDLVVYFTAYRCPDGVNCTGVAPPAAPWVEAGKAQVKYDDKGVFPPAAGARSVTVEAWQLLR